MFAVFTATSAAGHDYEHTGEVPAEWYCESKNYGSNDGCHCECGVVDPDCERLKPGHLFGCSLGSTCVNDQCVSYLSSYFDGECHFPSWIEEENQSMIAVFISGVVVFGVTLLHFIVSFFGYLWQQKQKLPMTANEKIKEKLPVEELLLS